MDNNLRTHINTYKHTILNLLKSTNAKFTIEQIEKCTNIVIKGNDELLKSLIETGRVVYEEDTLKFKHKFEYKNLEEFEETLKLYELKGIDINCLKDAPIDITPFIEQLKEENKIVIIKDFDGSHVLFYNSFCEIKASDEIKELWDSVQIGDFNDILKELNDKISDKKEKSDKTLKKQNKEEPKKKRVRRRIRITNTHVKDLDLRNLE